jgi:hypothetical protein
MTFMHGYRLVQFYQWLYRKVFKPKFKVGELVLIDDYPYEVIMIAKVYRPYTYFCLPFFRKHGTFMKETYFHESKIKKRTGLLKELE